MYRRWFFLCGITAFSGCLRFQQDNPTPTGTDGTQKTQTAATATDDSNDIQSTTVEPGTESINPTVENFEFSDQMSTGNSVVVDSVKLSEGGFIAILRESGDIIGLSGFLEAEFSHTNIGVALDPALDNNTSLTAVPFIDANGNEIFDANIDEPYTSGGSPVSATATVTVN